MGVFVSRAFVVHGIFMRRPGVVNLKRRRADLTSETQNSKEEELNPVQGSERLCPLGFGLMTVGYSNLVGHVRIPHPSTHGPKTTVRDRQERGEMGAPAGPRQSRLSTLGETRAPGFPRSRALATCSRQRNFAEPAAATGGAPSVTSTMEDTGSPSLAHGRDHVIVGRSNLHHCRYLLDRCWPSFGALQLAGGFATRRSSGCRSGLLGRG